MVRQMLRAKEQHYGKARGSGNAGAAAAAALGSRLTSELDFFFLINKYGLSLLK